MAKIIVLPDDDDDGTFDYEKKNPYSSLNKI